MDFKLILLSFILVALAVTGLLIKILIHPGSELPHSSCGNGNAIRDGGERCENCGLNENDGCSSDSKLK